MAVPSIKATLFQRTADQIEGLLASGRLSRETLQERLRPEDFHYLGKQLAASSWVPVATLARVAEIAIESEWGDSSEASLRAEGERAAKDIHALGLYKQFEATTERWGANAGRIIVTFASVAYNFGRWTYEPGEDPTWARIAVEGGRDLPEFSRITAEGFIGYMWTVILKAEDVVVTSSRPTPDSIVYEIRSRKPRAGAP
ncbi:MAG TPA: hypothetical protein VMR86_02350 [Myxococcota bacterium]|nr:hypothetical protein [Myxococcota bacterium]